MKFIIKNVLMMTKKSYLYDRFFLSNRNLPQNMLKISGFSRWSCNHVYKKSQKNLNKIIFEQSFSGWYDNPV